MGKGEGRMKGEGEGVWMWWRVDGVRAMERQK